jgi:uncharacterized protein (DUF2267 family)
MLVVPDVSARKDQEMPVRASTSFDSTVQKTQRILKEIENAYGWPKERRNRSYAALRSVLHAVRDRLTVDEAAHVAAQLPMLVRGMYYEGWDPSNVPVKMDREQFLERVARDFPYHVEGGVDELVHHVLQALRRHITEGEWNDVKSVMPRELSTAVL